MSKTILCRCEDITLQEVEQAVESGFSDIESIKRYLGVGTGFCQSKGCLVELARVFIEKGKAEPADMRPIVSRPPIIPISLRFFAGHDPREEGGQS